uniref:Uncharacterized protein n=1 Tax=viral metagenome TaxID=1070528 RepID=A0A6C0BA57_9ZZZZ
MAAEMDSEADLGTSASFQTLPKYYTDLNAEWLAELEKFPEVFEDDSISKDLVLSPDGNITIPDLEHLHNTDIEELFTGKYLPKIEEIKTKFEYKELQLRDFLADDPELPIGLVKFSRTGPDNEIIEINNMPEIERYIATQADEYKQDLMKDFVSYLLNKMDVLNGFSKPIDYDVILYLNLHGVLIEHKVEKDGQALDDEMRLNDKFEPIKGSFPILGLSDDEIARGKHVTILSATSPGISHILNPLQLAQEVRSSVIHLSDYSGKLDILKLQEELCENKKEHVKQINANIDDFYKKFNRETIDNYRHDIGWRIDNDIWLNKELIADDEFQWPIKVIRDTKSLINKRTFDDIIESSGRYPKTFRKTTTPYKPYISTDELIQYLLALGYINILLIDASCGDQCKYKTPRELRRFKRLVKSTRVGKGGKRTKKIKKRKTKRCKR